MEIPFIYGRLTEKDSFIDRVEERQELKNFLLNGINTILISPRRWGKSSLVKQAMAEVLESDKKTKVCFLDAYKIHTQEEFYNKFASCVVQGVSSLFEKRWTEFMTFLNRFSTSITIAGDIANTLEVNLKVNPAKDQPEHILQLPERIAEEKGIKVIVCIDEFQQLANIREWPKLEAMLRSEWQLQHHTTYCLYGSKMHMMSQIFNNSASPFFRFGQIMKLKPIDKQYWIPYIVTHFAKTGKTITDEQAEKICQTMRYNSWYVQQYCFFVWSHTERIVTDELLEQQLQLVLDTNEEVFQNNIENLAPSQIAMLKAIAADETHLNSKEVVERFELGQPRSITKNKKVIVEKDIVENVKGHFQFVDPLFELWLKREYNI